MKKYKISETDMRVSRIGYGCMGIGGRWDSTALTLDEKSAAVRAVGAAFEQGITFYDHADIYASGKSEIVFSEALKQISGLREKITIQSKCGIRFQGDPGPDSPMRYDFSYEHIMNSVNGSLKRLNTDVIDVLLLHRSDPLIEPEEVAKAFDELHQAGKVRYFGVSNFNAGQIALLQSYLDHPLVVNQLELNLLHSHLINDGIITNQLEGPYSSSAGVLDYCRLNNILIQAWGPVARGRLINPPVDAKDNVKNVAGLIADYAEKKETSIEAIVLAWLLKHPAGIQPIIGTTNVERIAASCKADEIDLSREEWFCLFNAARGNPVP